MNRRNVLKSLAAIGTLAVLPLILLPVNAQEFRARKIVMHLKPLDMYLGYGGWAMAYSKMAFDCDAEPAFSNQIWNKNSKEALAAQKWCKEHVTGTGGRFTWERRWTVVIVESQPSN
jgi:hypothetical protein